GAGVHEVRDHRETLAVDALFARMVGGKLLGLIPGAADGDAAAGRVVDLNRVTVVDDVQRRGLIGELNRRKIGRLRRSDVDRRLRMARLAGAESLVERAPVIGAV